MPDLPARRLQGLSGDLGAAAPARWRRRHDILCGVEPAPSEYPSLATMAGNAARAAAGFAAAGFATVDQAEQDRRLEVCRSCPEFDARKGRCRLCGCVARWKARVANEACPIGRW